HLHQSIKTNPLDVPLLEQGEIRLGDADIRSQVFALHLPPRQHDIECHYDLHAASARYQTNWAFSLASLPFSSSKDRFWRSMTMARARIWAKIHTTPDTNRMVRLPVPILTASSIPLSTPKVTTREMTGTVNI